jgi:RHS repeat-associated protein
MLSGTDYYPFGMAMRVGGDNKYKYGFNGKENDNEVKGGDGLQQDYGMRVYDNRLGRFLSVDPLTKSFAMLTPYQFASNSPIANIDLDGEEAKYFNIEIIETFDGKGKLILEEARVIEDKSKEAGWFVNGNIYQSKGELGSGTLFTYTKATKQFKEDGTLAITIEDNGALYTFI